MIEYLTCLKISAEEPPKLHSLPLVFIEGSKRGKYLGHQKEDRQKSVIREKLAPFC